MTENEFDAIADTFLDRRVYCKKDEKWIKENKVKILGFDSWTGGVRHFERLLPALEALSIQLTLVHISSWGDEPKCMPERKINNLLTRDIAFYGSDSFERVLDIEMPDAVILLSTDTFAHRAFIRYCEQRAIPTLYLYHGLYEVEVGEQGAYTISRPAYVRYVLSKIGKLMRHTLPCYIKALLKTKAKPKDWRRFMSDIYYLAIGNNYFIDGAEDAKTTKCAVYVKADVEHAIRVYGFRREDVIVVGNPDLMQFKVDESMIGNWARPQIRKPSVMYIETGFSSVGLFFSSEEDFANHLISTSRSLAGQGFQMCLKLKPHEYNVHLIKKYLEGSGIELVSNESFLPRLKACSACIIETTSLAIVPALFGMPLLMAKYGKLNSLNFGSILTSYPRGYLLEDVSDVSNILLKDAQTPDISKVNAWIDLNVGPLPISKMPERVAGVVEEMIAQASRRELT
jgi:hypothetical protein